MSEPAVGPRNILKLLTLDEVAVLLRKTPGQLRWMRHNGSGPKSAKLGGRVMYREQDVIDWVNQAFEDE
jgi:predicted DNA-binding transcriptional regulator AlpA